jgi:hypothetical protein
MAGVSTAGIVTAGTLMLGTVTTGVLTLGVLTLGVVTLGVLRLGMATGASIGIGRAGALVTTLTGGGIVDAVGVGEDGAEAARPGSPVPVAGVVAGVSAGPAVGELAPGVVRGGCTIARLFPPWATAARALLATAASCRPGPVAGAGASAEWLACVGTVSWNAFRWIGA